MKKILLLLLIATSLYSQEIDLSNDMIDKNEFITQKSLEFDVNATKPCIIIQWNVVLDVNIQNSQSKIDHVLGTVDAVVDFYATQNYQLIPTINYLSFDIDTAVFNTYNGSLYVAFNNFFPYKNTWGSDFDATMLVFNHGVSDYVGLASTVSMCNQFNNMSLALYWSEPWVQFGIIAHELGHNIGLPHIDQSILDVMNPSLRNSSQNIWSQGSIDNLDYFRQEYKTCLDTCKSLPLFTEDIRNFKIDDVCDELKISNIELADPFEQIYTTDYQIKNDELTLTVTTQSGKTFTKTKKVSYNDCFVVYPNPNTGDFEVRTSKPITKVEIMDVRGNIMLKNESYPPGNYFLRIQSKGNTIIKQVIIK